jgi:tRNA uridine 5-carboxymethylaminomethyl modification enzyme
MDIGREIGLINDTTYEMFNKKKEDIDSLIKNLKDIRITPKKDINEWLESIGSSPIYDGISLYDLLKRPEISFDNLEHFYEIDYCYDIKEQIMINVKYSGYIVKANKEAEKMVDLDNKKIPEDIDYDKIHNLASEAKQKLKQIKPTSIGQAIRISGINPADISLIMVYLKKEYLYDTK